MRARSAQTCEYVARTEALARGELVGAERDLAELHLADCDNCRSQFRQRVSGQLPRIRNYTLVSELGRGGFGVVYKALHHGKGRFEAVKVLFGQTDRRSAYFENEVRLVARLRHPNIATLYEASLNTVPQYYTMELVNGQHLDRYLHDNDVSLEQRIQIVRIVAGAVDYAHRQGVIHRDLKPQNILIDPLGQPRVVDFGIAKRLEGPVPAGEGARDAERGEGPLGTFGYIAPEQLAGEVVDRRADVFALGALLFHVITGQPARFASEPERLREMLHQRHVSRAEDLAAIIACCVDPAPDRRYGSAGELVEDLERFVGGRPITARRGSGAWYRTRRVAALTLRNWPVAAQVTATAVLAVLLSWSLWASGASREVSGGTGVCTKIVGVTPKTVAAARDGRIGAELAGFDPNDHKSWRVLYGELMRALSRYRPRAVVWDYYFPDCQPEHDRAFLAGASSLDCPLVVGALGVDVNGEPRLCPHWTVPEAVPGAAGTIRWGLVAGMRQLQGLPGLVVPLAMKPGLNDPVPTLALAAWSALQIPRADPDLRVDGERLVVRYRKHTAAPGESRWHDRVDRFPAFLIEASSAHQDPEAQRWIFARFPLEELPAWAGDVLDAADLLLREPEALRPALADKVVLIGHMVPPLDQHALRSGRAVFGCQLQAVVLNSLMNGMTSVRYSRTELTMRVCAWALLALLLAQWAPVRLVSGWRIRPAYYAALAAAGIVLAVTGTMYLSTAGAVESIIAAATLLACGAACVAIRSAHHQQLRLAPGVAWRTERSTGSTTVLAGSLRGPSASC